MFRLVRFRSFEANFVGRRSRLFSSLFSYKQGQYNEEDPKIREYFYYIDHNGMLFLDDARMKNFTSCFKEKKFLQFFFNRIKATTTPSISSPTHNSDLQLHFPFTSHCGRERNYIRVDATPFVFSNFADADNLEFNYTGLTRPFNAASLYEGSDGRLYHEFEHEHVTFALIKSQVADSLFSKLVYDDHDGGGGGGNNVGRPVAYKDDVDVVPLHGKIKPDVEKAISRVKK